MAPNRQARESIVLFADYLVDEIDNPPAQWVLDPRECFGQCMPLVGQEEGACIPP
jgi:hypothetical protein